MQAGKQHHGSNLTPLGPTSCLMELLGQVGSIPSSGSSVLPAAPAPHLGRGHSPAPAQHCITWLPGLTAPSVYFPQGVWKVGLYLAQSPPFPSERRNWANSKWAVSAPEQRSPHRAGLWEGKKIPKTKLWRSREHRIYFKRQQASCWIALFIK